MHVRGRMLRNGAATPFLTTRDHFYLTTIVESQLLLTPHQKETATVDKSCVKTKGEI